MSASAGKPAFQAGIRDEEMAIDQEARDLANKALGKLDTHEALCTERWLSAGALASNTDATASRIEEALNLSITSNSLDHTAIRQHFDGRHASLRNGLWSATALIFTVLLGGLGWALTELYSSL